MILDGVFRPGWGRDAFTEASGIFILGVEVQKELGSGFRRLFGLGEKG